jgi:hypothetical protein
MTSAATSQYRVLGGSEVAVCILCNGHTAKMYVHRYIRLSLYATELLFRSAVW